MQNQIRVLWIKDDRLGHLSKVEGTLYALSLSLRLEIHEVEVRWRPGFFRQIASLFFSEKTPIPFFIFLKNYNPKPIDLVISSGGKTEWVNARLAYYHQAQNIYIGSLRCNKPNNYNLLPIVTDKIKHVPYLSIDLIPSSLTYKLCRQQAEKELAHLNEKYWTLIIGGNGSGCIWTKDDWKQLAKGIKYLAKNNRVKLLITTSPRTGKKAENILKKYFQHNPQTELIILFNQSKFDPCIKALMGKAEAIFVTEDSSTMVNEAIFSKRPVYTLKPKLSVLESKTESYLTMLEIKNYIRRISSLEELKVDFSNHKTGHHISDDWQKSFGQDIIAKLNLKCEIEE